MNMSIEEIFKIVLKISIWALFIIIAITVVLTLAQGIIEFASSGIGAVILLLIGYKIYKTYKEMN